eukprot:scaffold6667_cov111-Isochrysis_galbana.AAC.2
MLRLRCNRQTLVAETRKEAHASQVRLVRVGQVHLIPLWEGGTREPSASGACRASAHLGSIVRRQMKALFKELAQPCAIGVGIHLHEIRRRGAGPLLGDLPPLRLRVVGVWYSSLRVRRREEATAHHELIVVSAVELDPRVEALIGRRGREEARQDTLCAVDGALDACGSRRHQS